MVMKNCPHWLKGSCDKGDVCDFHHDQAVKGAKKMFGEGKNAAYAHGSMDAVGINGELGGSITNLIIFIPPLCIILYLFKFQLRV